MNLYKDSLRYNYYINKPYVDKLYLTEIDKEIEDLVNSWLEKNNHSGNVQILDSIKSSQTRVLTKPLLGLPCILLL